MAEIIAAEKVGNDYHVTVRSTQVDAKGNPVLDDKGNEIATEETHVWGPSADAEMKESDYLAQIKEQLSGMYANTAQPKTVSAIPSLVGEAL